MAGILKILCNVCGYKASITKTARNHKNFSILYCSCKNPECNHSFTMNLEFGHTIKSSLLMKNELLFTLIDNLSSEDRQLIINRLTKNAEEKGS